MNKVKLLLYADDSKLISDVTLTQHELNKLINWVDKWQIELNLDKCKLIQFGNKWPAIHINMTNERSNQRVMLEHTDNERDLDIQITSEVEDTM